MFRVPSDAAAPTFDQTFKVGFLQWLTSSGADRHEWTRRRRAAAQTAKAGQDTRREATRTREHERYITRRDELHEREAEIKQQIRDEWNKRRR